MKIFKNGKSKTNGLLCVSMPVSIIKAIKRINRDLEAKYKVKFGESFVVRCAIDILRNSKDYDGFLEYKKQVN